MKAITIVSALTERFISLCYLVIILSFTMRKNVFEIKRKRTLNFTVSTIAHYCTKLICLDRYYCKKGKNLYIRIILLTLQSEVEKSQERSPISFNKSL